ncbi:hypothetical protein [uncultured Tenacibaculum sp.]|uniref:hypothetical protein n=1 Tax=uncultured Tenacibaculum sp. TaxID=174713 RepID=UPI00261D78C0|nr:hypothetical protein [uncultured Tenacibaculum sp.]
MKKEFYLYIIIIFLLLISSSLIYPYFIEISLSKLSLDYLQVIITDHDNQIKSAILFSLSIGALPLLYLALQKTTNINFLYNGIKAISIFILSGYSLWLFRIFQLNAKFELYNTLNKIDNLKTTINLNVFNLELYLFIGFIVGGIINIVLFKRKKQISL